MRLILKICLAGMALTAASRLAFSQESAGVTLQTVKYDGLREAVLKNRGKVVLVDFWAYF